MAPNSEHTSTLYQEIVQRLNAVQKKQQKIALLNGVLITAVVTLVLIVDAVILERAFSLNVIGRTILFLLLVLGIGACAVWYLGVPLLRILGLLPSRSIDALALLVGRHFPHIRDRLLNALQIFESQNASFVQYSPELVDAGFTDLYQTVRHLDFCEAVDVQPLRRMRRLSAYAAAVFLLIVGVSPPGFLSSVHRILNFRTAFAAPVPIHFVVEPGNVEVVRGSTVLLAIRTEGKPVSAIVLRTRQQGQGEFESKELRGSENTDGKVFRDSISNIKSTTDYFAEAEDVQSSTFRISVVDRPLIRSFRVHLRYPSYTRLSSKLLEENIGDVSAYRGTIVSVDISSSKELSSASFLFSDAARLPMNVEHARAAVRFPLTSEKSYHVVLHDRENLTNADPIEYQLKLIPDAFPTIAVIVPGRNVDVTEQMQLDLRIRIADDFGFSKLRLAYRLAHSRYEKASEEFSFVDISLLSKDQTPQEIWYRWNLTGLRLVPEDILEYYTEVFDNDDVSGPKSARSETYLVRLPSLDEVFRDVAQKQTNSMESLQSAYRDLQQIKKQMDELRSEVKNNREKADWQQQKKAEELQKQFEELATKLEKTAQRLEESIQQMQENKILSQETLEKYLELQKLMQELDAPELQKALKKLQEAMQQLSPDQIREAMLRVQMTEEFFRKSVERTIELLKRIMIEQKLDELLRRTEALIQQQENLRQQTAQTDPSAQKRLEELAHQQQELQKQLGALQQELANLEKMMGEFPTEMPLQEIENAQQQFEQQQFGQQIHSASRQILSGEMQRAQSNQQNIVQGLQKFFEQMQAAMNSLRENQQRQVLNAMRKAIQNILELSERQEKLKEETRELDVHSQRFRESAQRQMEIVDDLIGVVNSLTTLSRKTFAISPALGREIGKALQQMGSAMQSMEQRNPNTTSQSQGEAMASLNRTALMLQNAMNAMMQGGGGMGMAGLLQQLQQMAGTQMGINAQTQSLMGEGGGISPQQAAEWARLAGEQGAVQKSLEELTREAEQTDELSRLLGDLDKIAEEMREVQTDMEQNDVNPETLRKQERIFSRLLDSQRSMRERDYEKRRRAESGKTVIRRSPADIDLTTQEGRSKLYQELLRVLEQNYSKDYEELIRKYFEALEKEEANHIEKNPF